MSGESWNGIQIDNPANFTNRINTRTLSNQAAKGLRDTITSARILLSKVIPPIRSTKDKDYPLWPLIKFTRGHSSLGGDDFESPKLAILRDMSDILLTEMPNYRTNEDFKNYSYDKLAKSSIIFTPVEEAVRNLIAKPGIGIIYGNDRLILFYIKRLLNWFNEFKQNNSTITADDIVKGMKEINIIEIITNDYNYFRKTKKELNNIIAEINGKLNILYNNMDTNTNIQNNYRNTNTQNNYRKKEEERKWEKMEDSDSDDSDDSDELSGGKKRKSSRKVKRRKSSRRVKRRNTKRRYRK